MNAVAGRAEQLAERPVITRAHGTFSAFVVVASLLTGVLAGADLPLATPFIVVAALSSSRRGDAGGRSRSADDGPRAEPARAPAPAAADRRPRRARLRQRERAPELERGLRAGRAGGTATLTSVAPAVFAATVAVTRFAIGGLKPATPRRSSSPARRAPAPAR